MDLKRLLLVIAACALAPGAASAAVIITAFLGGPFSGLNPIGTLPATFVQASNTYDFTFDIVSPISGFSATQLAAIANGSVRTAELVQYQIYEGVPTTSDPENGTLLATSPLAFSPTVFLNLGPGQYYVNLLPAEVSINNEVVSGSFVASPVPEPAAWAMMLIGLGLGGAALRMRRAGAHGFPGGRGIAGR